MKIEISRQFRSILVENLEIFDEFYEAHAILCHFFLLGSWDLRGLESCSRKSRDHFEYLSYSLMMHLGRCGESGILGILRICTIFKQCTSLRVDYDEIQVQFK